MSPARRLVLPDDRPATPMSERSLERPEDDNTTTTINDALRGLPDDHAFTDAAAADLLRAISAD